MKIIDFDAIFDEFVSSFLEKNAGKYTETQLEDIQPKLFEKFSKIKIKNIGNITVSEYYADRKNQLLDILKEHIRLDISVNDFLNESIVKYVSEELLIKNLNAQFDCEYLKAIIKILSLMDSKKALEAYVDLLFERSIDEDTKSIIIDILCDNADDIYEKLLEKSAKVELDKQNASEVCEIISCALTRNQAIVDFLRVSFWNYQKAIPEFLSYIVKYGDDSLLGDLLKAIENQNVSYIDFKELRIAIEALGGTVKEERDFNFDANYRKLKGIE